MMQTPGSNGLGPMQAAGYPPGGGFGAPPGGGGFGAPPGGGGFGAPPGGGGFGPPPGGGFGAPPGAGGFGPPPGGGFAAGGGPMMGGARVNYGGAGGSLFAVYLVSVMLPLMGVYIGGAVCMGGVMAATRDSSGQPSGAGIALMGVLGLALFAGLLMAGLHGATKMLQYYWSNVTIEGKRCTYHGTAGGLFGVIIVPLLLVYCTMGIYSPWFACKLHHWILSQVDVQGERLQFTGEGGGLLGIWLIGSILTGLTFGIYFPWYHNNLLEYYWNNTSISGRGFRFQKDPGGFFGMWLLNTVLIMCTGGIYTPWAMSNQWDWEAKHIG